MIVQSERDGGDAVGWTIVSGSASEATVSVRPLPGNFRFAVRACPIEGCGEWSEWSAWVQLPDFG